MSFDLLSSFKNAEGEKKSKIEDFEVRQTEIAVSQGQLDTTQANLRMNFARAGKSLKEHVTEQRKKIENIHSWLVLLDQLEKVAAQAEQALQERYGEDYLSAMAEKYGIDTEGKSPEEIRKAMIEELQKDKYKDDPQAQADLQDLLAIEQANVHKAKINNEIKQNGSLSAETRQDAVDYIEKAGRSTSFDFGENNLDVTLSDSARDKAVEVTKEVHSMPQESISSLEFG